jgi:eukaryotic-like serine/threonine-protein kinase
MPRPAGTQVDQYELLEHLGDGAQAEVHRAKDLGSGVEVVIKFPHSRVLDNPVMAARWRRQVHLTEALAHPNIQCRLDVGQPHHEPYLVFEYAAGGSLDGWVNGHCPPPVAQVVEWGRQLAQALAFLHHLGIIHRDVKPGNILVDDNLNLKLADFGAATTTGKRHRLWRLPVATEGTAEYLSPEQVTGHSGDERSDIYGWGIVMYELLTGQVPYTGADPLTAMEAHLHDTPVPIRDLRPEVPPGIEAVVLTALRRYPQHRYPNVVALLGDLDHLGELDAADYDLSPEPPMDGVVGGSEGVALLRFTGLVAAGFIGVVAIVLALTIAFR